MEIYLVGGAVRDELLGREIKDRDWVVVGSNQNEMLSKGFIQVGKSFPVFLHQKTKEEYALARLERKVSPGYGGFEFDTSGKVTLEEDLGRRDLTINALAKDEYGNLIDPFGGLADLNARVLRHVSDAFKEDPLRVLRVARFYAQLSDYGFTVAPRTIEMMQEIVRSGELDHLSHERIFQESSLALTSSSPGSFVKLLQDCGAFKYLFYDLNNDEVYDYLQKAAKAKFNIEQILFILASYCKDSNWREKFFSHIITPKDVKQFIIVAMQNIDDFLALDLNDAQSILNFCNNVDVWRKQQRFLNILQVYKLITPDAIKVDLLINISNFLQDFQPNLDTNMRHENIGDIVQKQKVAAIANALVIARK